MDEGHQSDQHATVLHCMLKLHSMIPRLTDEISDVQFKQIATVLEPVASIRFSSTRVLFDHHRPQGIHLQVFNAIMRRQTDGSHGLGR